MEDEVAAITKVQYPLRNPLQYRRQASRQTPYVLTRGRPVEKRGHDNIDLDPPSELETVARCLKGLQIQP